MKKKEIIKIDREVVGNSLFETFGTKLYKFLADLVGDKDALNKTLSAYMVGGTKDGKTIFWQIDNDGNYRTGKVIAYNEDGRRNKSAGIGWAHTMLQKKGYGYKGEEVEQVLFGAHLLKKLDTYIPIVHICESEKDAIYNAMHDEDFMSGSIWVATGGRSRLNKKNIAQFDACQVIYHPEDSRDKDNIKELIERLELPMEIGEYVEQPFTEVVRVINSKMENLVLAKEKLVKNRIYMCCPRLEYPDKGTRNPELNYGYDLAEHYSPMLYIGDGDWYWGIPKNGIVDLEGVDCAAANPPRYIYEAEDFFNSISSVRCNFIK